MAALRPRLPAVEKAAAILRAFGHARRPYDFNFDFRTDATLVCSELIYKVYEPGPAVRAFACRWSRSSAGRFFPRA